MKLISLNTWGGHLFDPLMEFIKSEAKTTDIFCFQELYFSKSPHASIFGVRPDLALQIAKLLSGFSISKRLGSEGAYAKSTMSQKDVRIGEAIFVKKPIKVLEEYGCHTYISDAESTKEGIEIATGNFQYTVIKTRGKKYTIGNIHGLWMRGTKSDTPKRIEQSHVLEKFFELHPGKKILSGDFNLEPDTKSISILDSHMRDLIKEYKIPKTRSRYYADMKKYNDYIADYIFVSRDVKVKDFRALKNEVSDHLPLLLEFS